MHLEEHEIVLIDSLHGLHPPEMTADIDDSLKFKLYIEPPLLQLKDNQGGIMRAGRIFALCAECCAMPALGLMTPPANLAPLALCALQRTKTHHPLQHNCRHCCELRDAL